MLKTVVDVILISPHPGQTLCKASHLWEPLGNEAEVLPALGIHNGPRGWTATLQGGSGSPWAHWIPFVEINKDHLNEKSKGYQFRACYARESATVT